MPALFALFIYGRMFQGGESDSKSDCGRFDSCRPCLPSRRTISDYYLNEDDEEDE